MATEKQLKTRLIQKHDIEANWDKATSFIPKDGEIIIYDTDATHDYKRIKIGDGSTTVVNLPFAFLTGNEKTKVDNTNIAYGTCSTVAGTAAKVVTIVGNTQWKLEPGATIVVKFSATNTASSPTLNVNGTGAKRIWYNTALLGTSSLNRGGYASRYITYVYDGTQYVFQGWSVDDASDTKVTQANTTSNTTYNVLLSYGAASTSSVTNTVNKSANLQFNPSTKTLTVANLAGNATSSDGVNWGSW